MNIIKLPFEEFEESARRDGYGRGQYDPDDDKYYDKKYPSPFGEDLFDRVKANPRRGSSADKKDAFQNLLNSATGQLVAQVPSQMPGAMGGGFGHGIAGNVADIQQMPYKYGDQTGGIQQMPHIYGQQGGFNIMNPLTYGNMKRAIEGTRAGDKNMEYSNSPAGQIGKAANERNRLIQQMLGGY